MKNKILLVDDDPIFNKALSTVLQGEGYEVITAFDGEQALTFADFDEPDLILLDIIMPRKDGDEVFRNLKLIAKTNQIPVIIVSGAPPEDISAMARKRRIPKENIFIKPFNFNNLVARIKTILK